MTDLLRHFTRDAPPGHANQVPKDAATLILLDRSGPSPKVLLGRRHQRHVFLPGKFVFPGGSLDRLDRLMPVGAPLDPRAERQLMQHMRRPTAAKARALALAAIRECFEETGLLVGSRSGAADSNGIRWQDFAQNGILADLSGLHLIARAITPPRRPRRFDARFFAVDVGAIAHRVDGKVGPDSELVELVWLPIPEAKKHDLPTITQVALDELESRVARGFGHDLPSPFYRMLNKKFVRAEL
jgi:8-oxo-dGTP pyrophosphatase MutT (NUDIX family)